MVEVEFEANVLSVKSGAGVDGCLFSPRLHASGVWRSACLGRVNSDEPHSINFSDAGIYSEGITIYDADDSNVVALGCQRESIFALISLMAV